MIMSMAIMKTASVATLVVAAVAQNISQSIAPSATVGGSTIQNPELLTTSLAINVEDMWNLFVGPVSEAATTTTVSPTLVPSSSLIPPPPIYYSPFPSGQQQPMQPRNESWSFPKDFW